MRKKFLWSLLASCLLIGTAVAQNVTVNGKVLDEKGEPVSGASILVKGTQNGTTANAMGAFTLSAPTGSTLVVSALGFEAQQLRAGANIMIKLALDTKNLGEVVVTGLGSATSKKKIAFAVESVTADQIPKGGIATIDQALTGKVAGAQITSPGGTPGASAVILLRGINSINSGTYPMILVDGVQLGSSSLNTLDINSIEKVEIIQGAAASSIFGAQGANGVIQVFTKRGKAGIAINFGSSVASNTYINQGNVNVVKKHGFATDAENNVLDAGGNLVEFDPVLLTYLNSPFFDVLNPTNTTSKEYGKNLKWYDHLNTFMTTAPIYNHNISISGAKDKVDFNLYASNNKHVANFKNYGFNERSNFGSNIGIELFKGFKLRSTTQLVYTLNTVNGGISLWSLLNSKPFADYEAKTADGDYVGYFGNAAGVNGNNPNYASQYTHRRANTVDIIQSFNASYKLNKYVDIDAKYGLNYTQRDETYKVDNQSLNANSVYNDWYWGNFSGDNKGEIDKSTSKQLFQNFITTATARLDFEKDFHLNLPIASQTLVGYDYRNRKYSSSASASAGLPLYTPVNATQGTAFKVTSDYVEPFITYGYLVSQKFDWADKFGVSGGFRTDYSSAFGKGSKPFTFPNYSLYVRPSSFSFWKDGGISNIFPEMKVRAAYGEAGIQPGAFQRYNTLGTPLLGGSSAFSFNPNQPNPNLNVIISKELEAGIDLNFKLNSKASWFKSGFFSPTYWKKETVGDIIGVDAAPSTGVGSKLDNAFSEGSSGIQFKLGLDVYSSKNFTWNLTTLFGKQSSKITKVIGEPIIVTSAAGTTGYILTEGMKVGQLYGFLGLHSVNQINPETKQPYIDQADQSLYSLASNGWVVDNATKQPYFTPDQHTFGDPNPKFNMSFSNDFTIKDIVSINFQVDWLNGSHLYNQLKEWMYRDAIHKDYEGEITINGETGAWTAFYRGVYAQRQRCGTKSYFYEDASFVRLRNISVAIDLAKVFSLKPCKSLQLVLSGRNLVTLTKYTGFDPELNGAGNNSAWDRGSDNGQLPNFKTYQVGLNVGF